MKKFKHNPIDKIVVNSPFGFRNYGTLKFHSGVDYAPKIKGVDGDPVYAVWDGIVKVSKINGGNIKTGYGIYMVIEHIEKKKCTLYGHLCKIGLPVGTKVQAGQVIGYMGTTGDSTGTHLHFELRDELYNSNFFKQTNIAGQFPNAVDPINYILNEDDENKLDNLKKEIANLKDEITELKKEIAILKPQRYKNIDEMPTWLQKEIKILVENGVINGNTDGYLDFTQDMLRCIIISDRMMNK